MDKIDLHDLRRMNGKEGLILQGGGGSLEEWQKNVNNFFTENDILLDGTRFKNICSFEHDGVVCLLFPFEDVKLNIGKLAMWRLQTHASFGGTWLSDYVPNRLGGFMMNEQTKPDCPLIGEDGNIFNLMGIASRTLKKNGMADQAKEMQECIIASGSYDEALGILGEYVNITSAEDNDEDESEVMRL